MKLTMKMLENCFEGAIKNDRINYVALKIETKGMDAPEIIINPRENFKPKLLYYKNAYTDNLVLKSFNGIRITGFSFSDSLDNIEKDLIDRNLR